MERNGKIIEVRDSSGGVIFSLCIAERPLQDGPPETKETPQEVRNNGGKPKGSENPNPLAQDALMTDAQKRYLFRLLAEQGKEGEEAHEYLKSKIFQVNSLKEVTKFEASQAIERLLADQKGGAGK